MRRQNIFLLAGVPLCGARRPSFSIHDDVLAYPQFEVAFTDDPIPESEALSLIDPTHSTYDAGLASQTDLASQVRESSTATEPSSSDSDPSSILSESHHLLTLPGARYLCSIPVLAPPPPQNQTAAALARVEEARERDRASAAGWDIIRSSLDDTCLYFMSGWWSYSFCFDHDIVQFHALPAGQQKAGSPPVRDPQSAEYVLGRVPHNHVHQREELGEEEVEVGGGDGGGKKELLAAPPNSELAIKDNQKYLVQRLEGGTLCDLTGRERTIEVQYHCHPGIPVERIGWIKEVTTCTYLMVVQTPRLCNDVAFLPPKEGRAHPITCRPVGDGGKEGWLGIKGAGEGIAGQAAEVARQAAEVLLSGAGAGTGKDKAGGEKQPAPVTIGGVVVGGRKMLDAGGKGAKLPSPRQLAGARGGTGGGTLIEILAQGTSKADGGKVEVLSTEQLEKLDLSPEVIEDLKKELQKLAGDHGWKLEVVDVPGEGAEIRGIVEGDGDEEEQEKWDAHTDDKRRELTGKKGGKKVNDEKVYEREKKLEKLREKYGQGKEKEKGRKQAKDGDDEEDEGSEEVFYRDEL